MKSVVRTGQSTENRSDHNDSAIPTPRDLHTRNINAMGGSGTLPEGKKSMDSMVSEQKAKEMIMKA